MINFKQPRSPASHYLQIFLCHSENDTARLWNLYKKLQADGFEPWLEKERILPGQQSRQEIIKALRSSDVIIICLSPSSVNEAGYFQKIIKEAQDLAQTKPENEIFLIPLKLEECTVPQSLQELKWGNLFDEDGYERLTKSLRFQADRLGLTPKPDSVPVRPFKRIPQLQKGTLWGLALITILMLGVLASLLLSSLPGTSSANLIPANPNLAVTTVMTATGEPCMDKELLKKALTFAGGIEKEFLFSDFVSLIKSCGFILQKDNGDYQTFTRSNTSPVVATNRKGKASNEEVSYFVRQVVPGLK